MHVYSIHTYIHANLRVRIQAKVKALEAKVKSLEDELSLTQELAATKAAETKATVDKIVAALKRASISL